MWVGNIGSVVDAIPVQRGIIKMRFECNYCPAVFKDIKGLIQHFEREHRQPGKYTVVEVPRWMIEEEKEQ